MSGLTFFELFYLDTWEVNSFHVGMLRISWCSLCGLLFQQFITHLALSSGSQWAPTMFIILVPELIRICPLNFECQTIIPFIYYLMWEEVLTKIELGSWFNQIQQVLSCVVSLVEKVVVVILSLVWASLNHALYMTSSNPCSIL